MNETICKCFKLALEANGEKHGGIFERELFATYLHAFPDAAEDLLNAALEWVFDYDIGEHRIREVYNAAIKPTE